jgi:hypothetical protein
VLAAVGAWRTEAFGSGGDELDRKGVAQEAAFQAKQTTIRLGLVDLVQNYADFETARTESDVFAQSAALRVDAGVEASRAAALSQGPLTADGLDTKLRDDIAIALTTADLNGFDEFSASDRDLRKANRDAGFTALAVFAAFLLTLAQLIRRHLAVVLLILGACVFAAALALILLVELSG